MWPSWASEGLLGDQRETCKNRASEHTLDVIGRRSGAKPIDKETPLPCQPAEVYWGP